MKFISIKEENELKERDFIIEYQMKGFIKIKATSEQDAISRFEDKVGFSQDDIYECLDVDTQLINAKKI